MQLNICLRVVGLPQICRAAARNGAVEKETETGPELKSTGGSRTGKQKKMRK